MSAVVSLGIAAAAGADVAAHLAPAVEQAGFHGLWVNDTPGADALGVLAAAASVTDRLVLATGVLPVDRRGTDEILDRVAHLGLPQHRLVLGIGSGTRPAGALARVTEAAAALEVQSQARIVVGALGPRMRRLAVTAADGVLLSWLTPHAARSQAREAHDLAPGGHVALYVRAATDAAAISRLDDEADRYAGYPAYAANFERLGIAAGDTVMRPDDIADSIAAYREAVDEVVLRAIVADDTVDAYLSFVAAAAAVL
ncbi:LLM class flavin-dependent oxidoreductase [Microbacterium sp. NEAU-LLC]|uniref:LLM class flavin-dependent oxidoreductase n=1 Tax=Microbacterium helvum TaxID=2773713 RepID=A0ABR8NSE0_9MICO|nr:LLM class flavin-dependent oxidoreductase [Microbacterium helvum]MBD3942471.1 LLM class flavin-dependent oxidoreductase [Microbacterium helvum]